MEMSVKLLMMVVMAGATILGCGSSEEFRADGAPICRDCGDLGLQDGEQNDTGSDVEKDASQRWSYCPEDSGVSDGEDLSRLQSCDGAFTQAGPTEDDARHIYGRLIHEVGHVRDVMLTGAESGVIRQVDDGRRHLEGMVDHGFMSGIVRSQDRKDGIASCATLRFECWSGGHGGFGPSALEGDVRVIVEEPADASNPTMRITGAVGLVESGPLQGTRQMDVDIAAQLSQTDGWIGEGTIGGFPVADFLGPN